MFSTYLVFKQDVNSYVDLLYTPNDPVAVANDFWLTALKAEPAGVEKFLATIPPHADLIPGYNPNDRAEIGSSQQDNGRYYIDTTLYLHRDGRRHVIPLYTAVTSENGQFKVDFDNTLYSVHDAALQAGLDYYIAAVKSMATYFTYAPELSVQSRLELLSVTMANIDKQVCDLKAAITHSVAADAATNLQQCDMQLNGRN